MAKSDLVQVSPQEFIRRKPGETDADVRKRYERLQQLERRTTEARRGVDKYDGRKRRDSAFEEGVVSLLNTIPRELARREYKKTEAELRKERGYAKGGSVASKRADGCATKGKTKGRFV